MKFDQVKELLQKRYGIRGAEFLEQDQIDGYIYHFDDEIIIFPIHLIDLCGNDNWVEFVNLITKLDTHESSVNYVLNIDSLIRELEKLIYGEYNYGGKQNE